MQIALKPIDKQPKRFVARIEFYGAIDVALHGMRFAIVSDRSERFLRTEQTVGPRKCLNNVFVPHQFIEVKRIDPFRIEPRQHLVYYDQQIDLLLRITLDPHICLFVRQSQRNVFFESLISRYRKFLVVTLIIVFQHFNNGVLFQRCAFVVVDILIEQCRYVQTCFFRFEKTVIRNRFGNAVGCKNRVKFPAATQRLPTL